MGFGTSFSITKVDCLDWVHTRAWKKIVRGVAGVGITVGVYLLLKMIKSDDSATIFVLHHALPALLFSLFIYGIYPLICKALNLVD